ncbi:helix-turn-helix domain-containing protein [Spirosoma sp. HMF4905]|uniref:Helix-turn-helix domain-containing protein n=1 Tax=Spirosoma arboris TaxID=2682092 RepID=A0A7K1SMQ9_9BACT|nr:recombinase family protein [Spirosoma arboris]MVM34953.1 helix-turn-helix domain-containing protein [Spirosoma arboris]
MKIGYARVSTLDQNLDLQLNALQTAGCEKIYQEKISGACKERPELEQLLKSLRPGDEVMVWKLDRLGRSLQHLIELINLFSDHGVTFSSLQDSINTSTPSGKLIFHIFCSLAEFERAQIRERTMAGLAAAKLKGKTGGKPKGLSEQAQQTARVAESLYKEGFAIKLISEKLKLSRQTVYNYLAERGVTLK